MKQTLTLSREKSLFALFSASFLANKSFFLTSRSDDVVFTGFTEHSNNKYQICNWIWDLKG